MGQRSHQMTTQPSTWRPKGTDKDREINKTLTDLIIRLSIRDILIDNVCVSYVDQSDSQRRDPFQVLPSELLQHIARYVAVNLRHDYKSDFVPLGHPISHHLFKSRLICSAFSRAAVAAFKQLCNEPGYKRYTVLQMPPYRASTQSMLSAMSCADSGLASVVKAVLWEVHLQDYENKRATKYTKENGSPIFRFTRAHFPDGSHGDFQATTLDRLIKQRELVDLLCSSSGREVLQRAFRGITNLNLLDIAVVFAPHAITKSFPVYRKLDIVKDNILGRIFNCLEAQSSLQAENIELQRIDPRVFNQVPAWRVLQYDFNYALKDVHISFRSDQNYANFNEGSAKWNLFLSGCCSLSSLTITFRQPGAYKGKNLSKKINIHWLRGLLQNQHWPHLKRFFLRDFVVKHGVLDAFFNLHSSSLRDIELRDIEIEPRHWVSLLNNMRDLELDKARVVNEGGSKYWMEADSHMEAILCEYTRVLNIRAAKEHNLSPADTQHTTYCITDLGFYVSGEVEKVIPFYEI